MRRHTLRLQYNAPVTLSFFPVVSICIAVGRTDQRLEHRPFVLCVSFPSE